MDDARAMTAAGVAAWGAAYSDFAFPDPEEAAAAMVRRGALVEALEGRAAWSCGGTKPHVGPLSPGCALCTEGAWSCLFVNSICGAGCFFCPGSGYPGVDPGPPSAEQLVFEDLDEHVAYVQRLGYRGVGYSGGEALRTPDRVLAHLRALRRACGPGLRTWLYTHGGTLTRDLLVDLRDAGLDEIRLNVVPGGYDLGALERALEVLPAVVEIPAVPEDRAVLLALLDDLDRLGVGHLHLHQLAAFGSNAPPLQARGYRVTQGLVPAVVESELLAVECLVAASDRGLALPVHYCSTDFKGRWQLRGLIRHQGALVRRPWESESPVGYLRHTWVDHPGGALVARVAALDPARGRWRVDDGRLDLHPDLLEGLDLGGRRARVRYHLVRLTQGQVPRGSEGIEIAVGASTLIAAVSAVSDVLPWDGTPEVDPALVPYERMPEGLTGIS